MSQVEDTLRSQRDAWREIADRVAEASTRDFPPEGPRRILLFGVGSSHHAAHLTALSIIRARGQGKVPVIACPSLSVGLEVIPAKGDWAFGFTHRGGSKPTLDALGLCESAGAFTIMVCGKGAQPAEAAKFHLETVPLETVEPHTASVTGAICGVTTLLMGNKALEEWDALRSLGDPDLDLMRRRAGEGPTAIVGEWEGEWLAREGALKLMEMARLPVRAHGSEEYCHGPRRSVGESDRLWHVSVARDPRNNELKPAHRVGVFGSTPLAWVPALIELQWLALAVALNRGVDPDLK